MSRDDKKTKTFKQKWENFWYYHKVHVFIAAFFLFAIGFLTVDVMKKHNPDYTVGYVGSFYVDQTQLQAYEPVFKEIVGDLNGDGRVLINYQTIVVSKNIMTNWDIDTEQQMNYSFVGGEIRLYIIEEKYIKDHEQYFEPLDGIIDEAFLKGGYKNREGKTILLPLKDTPVLKKMEINSDSLYIGIRGIAFIEQNDEFVKSRHEKSKEILKYIIGERNGSFD